MARETTRSASAGTPRTIRVRGTGSSFTTRPTISGMLSAANAGSPAIRV